MKNYQEFKKALAKEVEGLDLSNLDILEVERITNNLCSFEGVISYTVENATLGEEDFLMCLYFSEKLKKRIVFNEDLDFTGEAESLDEMAQSMWEIEKGVRKMEANINYKNN